MACPNPKKSVESGIPDDSLVEILSRLPVKPVRRAKCVSKAWCDLIDNPLHRKKLPQTLEGFFFGDGERQSFGRFIHLLGTSTAPPVDPSFPFLKELPVFDKLHLMESCNGLLLFEHDSYSDALGYIVCNPATEQWVAVPGYWTPVKRHYMRRHTNLVFDPVVSSHFHVVEFWERMDERVVNIYSSETGVWSCRELDWGDDLLISSILLTAFANGMLYMVLYGAEERIAAVDVGGNVRKIIPAPFRDDVDYFEIRSVYVGQSQGHLHYIYHVLPYHHADDVPSKLSSNVKTTGFDGTEWGVYELLFIWVLEDYETQQWVLKHTVSFLELFGNTCYELKCRFEVIAIHPDSGLVYVVHYNNRKLISYDMNSQEVCDICTFGDGFGRITPYVPYFSELSALQNKN
ncbi:hypothetical protein ACP70R_014745 [Stipagrostis hirtigluma subsp. patula]